VHILDTTKTKTSSLTPLFAKMICDRCTTNFDHETVSPKTYVFETTQFHYTVCRPCTEQLEKRLIPVRQDDGTTVWRYTTFTLADALAISDKERRFLKRKHAQLRRLRPLIHLAKRKGLERKAALAQREQPDA
jgi:hypothetical protein